MRTSDLDYDLPEDRIAQVPAPSREDARMLVLDLARPGLEHARITDLPARLGSNDLLVVNDTRVIPARLVGRRETGGRVEVLLLAPDPDGDGWTALAKAGGTLGEGERLALPSGAGLRLVRGLGEGQWLIQGDGERIRTLIARHGQMPLPPYIRREEDDPRGELDRERYQTVFAAKEGAIAAPTAGLHLTPSLFDAIEAHGVEIAHVTLHVGLGTFEPVRTDDLDDHRMHEERYVVPEETVAAVKRVRKAGGRVVAVGTTSARALEAAAAETADGIPRAGEARTRLLIQPGYDFRVVDALLTNFHLPRSTLLALVAALAGRERILDAYAEAVAERYRFYSYGDAMLIL